MRERLGVFAADVNRFGPLAVVSLATVVCLPSLLEFFSGRLAITSMLGRYCAAFLLATIGVKAVSSVRAEVRDQETPRMKRLAATHRSPDGASDRRELTVKEVGK